MPVALCKNQKNRRIVAVFAALSVFSWPALGQSADDISRESVVIPAPRTFGKDQIGLELTRDYPIDRTFKNFSPSLVWNPVVAYKHVFSENWFAAISGGFKSLAAKAGDSELVFFVASHEVNRMFRLNDPLYLTVGAKVQYLAPIKERKIPSERDPSAKAEMGAAVSIGLISRLQGNWLIHARYDRWRGTYTTKYQATEVAFGFTFDRL